MYPLKGMGKPSYGKILVDLDDISKRVEGEGSNKKKSGRSLRFIIRLAFLNDAE
jgi:hypothetical protein